MTIAARRGPNFATYSNVIRYLLLSSRNLLCSLPLHLRVSQYTFLSRHNNDFSVSPFQPTREAQLETTDCARRILNIIVDMLIKNISDREGDACTTYNLHSTLALPVTGQALDQSPISSSSTPPYSISQTPPMGISITASVPSFHSSRQSSS